MRVRLSRPIARQSRIHTRQNMHQSIIGPVLDCGFASKRAKWRQRTSVCGQNEHGVTKWVCTRQHGHVRVELQLDVARQSRMHPRQKQCWHARSPNLRGGLLSTFSMQMVHSFCTTVNHTQQISQTVVVCEIDVGNISNHSSPCALSMLLVHIRRHVRQRQCWHA
jgi:hypothetical protein